MTLLQILPWSLSASTAFCFGVIARRSGRNALSWAALGGTGSLVFTTTALGALEASFLQTSEEAYSAFCSEVVLLAILLNLLPGWVVTAGMHRQHLALLNAAKGLWTKVHSGPKDKEDVSRVPSSQRVHRKPDVASCRRASASKLA